MPFGSFWIKKNKGTEREPAKPSKRGAARPVKEETGANKEEKTSFFAGEAMDFSGRANGVGGRISILLLGDSQRLICNYLCSMNINMNEIVGREGLAFYTEDHRTISRMVAAKKELDGIFYRRGQLQDELEERELEGEQTYSFRISVAGKQSKCLELIFTCLMGESLEQGWAPERNFDSVWILTEEPCLRDGRDDFLYECLEKLRNAGRETPVLFLVSQFEYLERFRVLEQEVSLSYQTQERLAEYIRNLWRETAGEREEGCEMLQVQIYGGLEFTGWDEQGRLRLEVSKSGFYQRYIPVGCQMPVIYTVNACTEGEGADFLQTGEGNDLMVKLSQIFHPCCESEALSAKRIEVDGQ